MRLATKLGLAQWFEAQAANIERTCAAYVDDERQEASMMADVNRYRVAAKALRLLTDGQEVELLEWQVGGPDGIGADSYDNPITVLRPSYVEPQLPRKPNRGWWGR